MSSHLFIPDTQVHKGVPLDHLRALGHFIVENKPDVIIHIGDHADMPSLSMYEKKGSKYFHGKSYAEDIIASHDGMDALLGPLRQYNFKQSMNKKKQYHPRMVLCLGNHENRITRAISANPVLEGTISLEDLHYEDYGWEVVPFLEVVRIDGVSYSHYFCNPDSLLGGTLCGTVENKLKLLAHSFSMGHQQKRQYGTRYTGDGRELHGLVCGAFYMHDEDYMGPQANRHHWRGVVLKNEVVDGQYDPCFLSLQYLLRKYG